MGILRRLFGTTNDRPSITQTDSLDPEKINQIVSWFIANENGIRTHMSLTMSSMLLAGYEPTHGPVDALQLECDADPLKCGLRNRVTFAIYGRVCSLRQGHSFVIEQSFAAHLDEIAGELHGLAVAMCHSDPDASKLLQILADIEEPAHSFVNSPNPWTQVSQFRDALNRRVLRDQTSRHIAALFIAKSVLEIEFYILCWLYFSWYGTQYHSRAVVPA